MSVPFVFALSLHDRQRRGSLAFGQGNAKVRAGDKLSNSRKTVCEQTPRMTPNRLLAVGVFTIYSHALSR